MGFALSSAASGPADVIAFLAANSLAVFVNTIRENGEYSNHYQYFKQFMSPLLTGKSFGKLPNYVPAHDWQCVSRKSHMPQPNQEGR